MLYLLEPPKAGGCVDSNLRETAIVIELVSKSVTEQAIDGALLLWLGRRLDFFGGLEEWCGFRIGIDFVSDPDEWIWIEIVGDG